MKIAGTLRVAKLEDRLPLPFEKSVQHTVDVTLRDARTGVTLLLSVTPEDARDIHLGDELPYSVGT